MRTAFRIVASLTSLAVIVQVGLAGYGAFNAVNLADDGAATKHAVENGFDPHGALGTIVLILLVLLVLASLAAGRVHARTVAVLLLLGVAQMLLAWGAESQAWVGFFHGVNALAIAGIAGSLAGNEWKEARVASSA